jgi:hypothetical protein
MERFTKQKLIYANILSRAIFKDSWDRQGHIPPSPPVIVNFVFNWLEKNMFYPDLKNIKIEKPIFILGPPRSGTTMLQDVMCAHSDICYIQNIQNTFPKAPLASTWIRESLNLNITGERYLQDSIIVDATSPAEPSLFWKKWVGHTRDTYSLEWPIVRSRDLSHETKKDIEVTLKKILYKAKTKSNKPRFFCKYPIFTTDVLLLNDLFPDAKFIHIIRDGRAVANSLIKLYELSKDQIARAKNPNLTELIPYPRVKNLKKYIDDYGPASLETTARVWNDCLDYLSEQKGNIKNFHEVRYEDILEKPKEQMSKIWDFCEMKNPIDESLYQVKYLEIGKINHKNQYEGFDLIEKICHKNLIKFGYL